VEAAPVAPGAVSGGLDAAPAGGRESAAEELAVEFVEVPDLLAGPSQEQLRELDFFIEQGLREDAARLLTRLQESFGDHPAVVARHALLKSRGWDESEAVAPPAAESASELFSEEEQFFDLAAELERELAEDELVAQARGAARDAGEEESIEELFKEFQRGVAEQLSDEDYDTHFNLGLAYREMGLLNEAIGEFQLALKSPELFLEAVSMIAACYVEKGLPDEAAGWYAKGLEAPNLPPEVEIGLHYELGRALEAGGRTASALNHYAEVLARNPTFRDVVERVERLRMN
jgi:tetratricopeptide (TPR) repeat protein